TKIIFGQLATIVTMALIASLFSALLLTPMLCSKFLKAGGRTQENKLFAMSGRLLTRLEEVYGNFLKKALRNRWKVLGGLVALFMFSLALIPLVGVEYMPQQDQGFLFMEVELPTGTRFEETRNVCMQIYDILKEHVPEMKSCVITFGVGESAEQVMFNPKKASNTGKVEMVLTSKNTRAASAKDIISRVRPYTDKIPGAIIRFTTSDPIGEMIMGASSDFSIDIFGHDLDQGVIFARSIVKALGQIENLKDIEISQKLAKPELQVKVDREKVSSLGLNVTDVARAIELYFSGDKTVKYREGGEEYDVEVRLRAEDRLNLKDLDQVSMLTPTNEPVRLSNLANIIQTIGPTRIERSEQQRYIKISGQVFNTDPGTVIARAAEVMKTVPVPPGFSWEFSGNEKERVESFLLMLQAAVLGMILVYMVMASQFESLLAPFIIFL
ncbi:MAG TPA: efflux RND transporter permease subunit, partial [Candidatus Rifleibacterium sp.]|nr:efflux RND transporter permease subunit [Candidatus Rifleibacterium sp.]